MICFPKKGLAMALMLLAGIEGHAAEVIEINAIEKSVLLDGQCGHDEWDLAKQFKLPADVNVYLMFDAEYFYLCAQGKKDDYTVLDLYIENSQTQHLHHFHLSAQMGERIRTEDGWGESATWDLQGYAGFWVPYYGLEDPDNRKGPKFARGTARQLQISRSKFPGDQWKTMIGISGVKDAGENIDLFFPEKAVDTDPSTWSLIKFQAK